MDTSAAIKAFAQSEKIKAGLIWISQALELFAGLPENDKKGAHKTARSLMGMILLEIHLAKRSTQFAAWAEAEKNLDLAIVMADSGVPHESTYHLTRALSHVTTIGNRSMGFLKQQGLL